MKQSTVLTKSILLLGIGALLLLAACEGGAPTSVSICDKLDAPTLTSPDNGANMPRKPVLEWQDVDDETGYRVEVFAGSGCSGTADYDSQQLSAGTTTHTVNPELAQSTFYAWHVIAVGNCESGEGFSDSQASECRTFTTGTT